MRNYVRMQMQHCAQDLHKLILPLLVLLLLLLCVQAGASGPICDAATQ
jgi:hypothetical protein